MFSLSFSLVEYWLQRSNSLGGRGSLEKGAEWQVKLNCPSARSVGQVSANQDSSRSCLLLQGIPTVPGIEKMFSEVYVSMESTCPTAFQNFETSVVRLQLQSRMAESWSPRNPTASLGKVESKPLHPWSLLGNTEALATSTSSCEASPLSCSLLEAQSHR